MEGPGHKHQNQVNIFVLISQSIFSFSLFCPTRRGNLKLDLVFLHGDNRIEESCAIWVRVCSIF